MYCVESSEDLDSHLSTKCDSLCGLGQIASPVWTADSSEEDLKKSA